jgi:hypothetical protein
MADNGLQTMHWHRAKRGCLWIVGISPPNDPFLPDPEAMNKNSTTRDGKLRSSALLFDAD